MITSFYPMEDGIKFDVLAEYPGVDPKWTWVGIGLSVDGPKPPTQYIPRLFTFYQFFVYKILSII